MARPRAADDFDAIRARIDELRRQREEAATQKSEPEIDRDHLRLSALARRQLELIRRRGY